MLTTASASFDSDPATQGTEYYDVEVIAADQGGLSITEILRINVLDVNDNAPIFSEPVYHKTIREDDNAGNYSPQVQISKRICINKKLHLNHIKVIK